MGDAADMSSSISEGTARATVITITRASSKLISDDGFTTIDRTRSKTHDSCEWRHDGSTLGLQDQTEKRHNWSIISHWDVSRSCVARCSTTLARTRAEDERIPTLREGHTLMTSKSSSRTLISNHRVDTKFPTIHGQRVPLNEVLETSAQFKHVTGKLVQSTNGRQLLLQYLVDS